jgi:hypothetical protein
MDAFSAFSVKGEIKTIYEIEDINGSEDEFKEYSQFTEPR